MTQEERERAVMEKGKEILRAEFDKPESKLRNMLQDAIVEKLSKLALRDTWPELFGDWTDEQVGKATPNEMMQKIHDYLWRGIGRPAPDPKFPKNVIDRILKRAIEPVPAQRNCDGEDWVAPE